MIFSELVNKSFIIWCDPTQILWGKSVFLVGLVKNGCTHSGLGTVKLVVTQVWIDEANWFSCWYKLGKLKVT